MIGVADVASVATAVGVAAGIYQLRLSWRQGRASFEQSFVDRYWSIEDDRLRGTDTAAVNRERYLRLCEDQFEHARMGQISKRTWVIWHDGIRAGLGEQVEGSYAWAAACVVEGAHEADRCPAVRRV